MSEERCAKCGYTAVPTPGLDFYTCDPVIWSNPDEHLCEICFMIELQRYLREKNNARATD